MLKVKKLKINITFRSFFNVKKESMCIISKYLYLNDRIFYPILFTSELIIISFRDGFLTDLFLVIFYLFISIGLFEECYGLAS
jgi:hypothetical protein